MNQMDVKRQQIKRLSQALGCIGLLLLGGMFGSRTIAYLGAAYECYFFLWILLGSNAADALGRMLRLNSIKGQHRNGARAGKYVMLLQCILGLAGAALLAILGNIVMVRVFLMPRGAFVTAVLAPAFFLRMAGGVFQGYLLGDGMELPAWVSEILRQVFFAGFGFLFGSLAQGYGAKVSALLGQEDFIAMYGAMGIAAAIFLSELACLLFLMIAHKIRRKNKKSGISDGMWQTGSFGGLIRNFYSGMMWGILVQFFSRLPIWLGLVFLQKSGGALPQAALMESFGEYYGRYLAFGAVFILLADAVMTAAGAKAYVYIRREENAYANVCLHGGLHFAAVQGLYFGAFWTALAGQIAGLFGSGASRDLEAMMRQGGFLVFFLILAGYFARLLVLGKSQHLAVAGLGIMNVVFVISAAVFLNSGHMGILSLVYAGLLGSGALCLVLGFLACRQLGIKVRWVQAFVIPMIGSALSGALCWLLGKTLAQYLGNAAAIPICFAISYILYFVILIFLRNFREIELRVMPGGKYIRAFGQMLHLYR